MKQRLKSQNRLKMLIILSVLAIIVIAYFWYASLQVDDTSVPTTTIEQDLNYENNSKKDESDADDLPNIVTKDEADVSGQTDDSIVNNKGLKASVTGGHIIIPKDPDDTIADVNLTNAEDNGTALVEDIDNIQEPKTVWQKFKSLFSSDKKDDADQDQQKQQTAKTKVEPKVVKKTYPYYKSVVVESGQLLNQILENQGFNNKEAYQIIQELDKQGYSAVRIHPGDQFTFIFNKPKLGEKGVIPETIKLRLNYKQDVNITYKRPTDRETITSENLKKLFTTELITYKNETHIVKIEGEIKNTLDGEAIAKGMSHSILYKFKNLYGWSVDFRHNIHPGDKFEVMYKENTYRHGKTIQGTKILYANLNISHHDHPLYFFNYSKGMSDYFNSLGMSARHTLLRRPVVKARISSKFSPRRWHPILKKWLRHTGIDYACPKNTPIFAGGKGVVQFRGWIHGYGNVIIIHHNSVYTSYYAHMNHFQVGMRVGTHVRKGQVIGFVGMTGYATGYHVHYEIRKYGKPIDPLGPLSPAGENLKNRTLVKFKSEVLHIKSLYKTAEIVKSKQDGTEEN